MLRELNVKNIVLIENLTINFEPGLSVLTGETGAGKSILLDSIGLILGNKVDFSLVRNNSRDSSVTAIFDINEKHPVIQSLENYNIDHEYELIIRREIKFDGKSKCVINDKIITRNALIEITDYLIEVQGQFEDRGLLNIKTHLSLLDAFANHNNLIETTQKTYKHMTKLKDQITKTEIESQKNNDDNEWVKDSFNQLALLAPQIDEESELDKNKKILINQEKIYMAISQAKIIIEQENGLEDLIIKLNKILDKVKSYNINNINNAIKIISETKAEVEELKNIINSKNLEIIEDELSLESIEDRLYELRLQARKHNCKVDELLIIKENLRIKIDQIDNNKFNIDDLNKQFEEAKRDFINESDILTNSRKNAANLLSNKINKELPHLKLENAKLAIKFDRISFEESSHRGLDKVTFLASTNFGSDMLPINKIASGGELSRFLLALKVVLESVIHNRTIIFFLFDSGIGGAAANAVGDRLAKLGDTYQTMVVTHSPQVTSKGRFHYLVKKKTIENETTTDIVQLNHHDRIEEIARMLSGKTITNEAREAAFILIDNK